MDAPPTESSSIGPTPAPGAENEHSQKDEYSGSRNGKFRFKSSESKSRRSRDDGNHHHGAHRRHHKRHRHHEEKHGSSSSSKRHKKNHDRSPSPSGTRLSPGAAFRESLFDALGDDEGAEYWASIYGQPIHIYPKPSVATGPDGELEQMDDEEYAAYVRAKMWEKTHEGIIEERERLKAEKARQKERRERCARERVQFEREIEESLRRGQERRRVKVWKTAWEEYQRCWEEMNTLASGSGNGGAEDDKKDRSRFRNVIFWPVESGKRRDVSRAAVEEFMQHAPPPPPSTGGTGSEKKNRDTTSDLLSTLKAERFRWHPDKIQHRYGSLGIDETVMQSVTEVFQIIDRMWNEQREKQGTRV